MVDVEEEIRKAPNDRQPNEQQELSMTISTCSSSEDAPCIPTHVLPQECKENSRDADIECTSDASCSRKKSLSRAFGGCLLIFVVTSLVLWTRQVRNGHRNQHLQQREGHKNNAGLWDSIVGMDLLSNYEDTTVVGNNDNFSCNIGTMKLGLSQSFPDLIIPGAAKSGTTTLAQWLLDHPNVLPTKKWECHFFNTGIHPREFEPLLNYTTFSRSSSSNKANNDTNSTTAALDELICRLRKRYLHEWPDLSDAMTANSDGNGEATGAASHIKHGERMYTFDKTPDYLYPSRVPALIRAMFAKSIQRPKIVVLLRNPIDRAYSQYRMDQRMMREEHIPFEEFIEREIALLKELGLTEFQIDGVGLTDFETDGESEYLYDQSPPPLIPPPTTTTVQSVSRRKQHFSRKQLDQLYDRVSDELQGHNYLARSMYAMQLERWFRHDLGKDMLILPYTRMSTHPAEFYAQVLDFMGMPPHELSPDLLTKKFNYNDAVTDPLRNTTRDMLARFFRGPNEQFIELLQEHNHTGGSLDYDWRNLLNGME